MSEETPEELLARIEEEGDERQRQTARTLAAAAYSPPRRRVFRVIVEEVDERS